MMRNTKETARTEGAIRTGRFVERAKQTWEPIAGEPLDVEIIKGAVYAFGSELACLRLYYKMKVGRANWSTNLQRWYYCNQ